MPKQEGENETHANTHNPSHQHDHEHSQISHGLKDRDKVGHAAKGLREHLGLLQLVLLFVGLLLMLFGDVIHLNGLTGFPAQIPERDLRGHDQRKGHVSGEGKEAHIVVPLASAHGTFCVLEELGMVKHHAHDEHGDGPTN